MTSISKALFGTVAAGAMAISAATPAMARDHRGGISTGEVIAGALVLGGIAAVVASSNNNNDNDYRYDRAGYDGRGYNGGYGYNNGRGFGGNPRQAIEMCVRTAERQAGRYSYGKADVTDVRDVRQTRWGYEVRGRIAVNAMGHGWRNGDNQYGRGWGGDYRGWNSNHRGYDSGSFKCRVERGRVTDIDFNGVRGLD
jgi:hypothetical protein